MSISNRNTYMYIRGVMKKFVHWYNEINTIKAMLKIFYKDNKNKKKFYRLQTFKPNTSIIK